MSRQGIPDYLVVMRTPGDNTEHVSHTHETFPVSLWQRYASPVWATIDGTDPEGFGICTDEELPGNDDSGIDATNTLQGKSAREHDDERHIAPLQLGVIARAIRLWTNPNDVVWTPFLGIGSEAYVAIKEGRRAVGAELKRSYFEQAARNLAHAADSGQQNIFDLLEQA